MREWQHGIDAVLDNLKDIKELNGTVRKVSVEIQSNGAEKSEDPAFYGAMHDDGSKYSFSREALKGFGNEIMNDRRVKKYFHDMVRIDRKRRTQKDMDNASIIIAQVARERVLDYILYDMPQRPQHWKKGERNLIETEALIDALIGKVEHKDGRLIWRGV